MQLNLFACVLSKTYVILKPSQTGEHMQKNRNKFKTLNERFEEHLNVGESKQCWEWGGNINNKGYGSFSFKNKKMLAHRVSYEIFVGTIKKGFFVCHKCDNRKCVNPAHLYEGTALENNRDTMERRQKKENVMRFTKKEIEEMKERMQELDGKERIELLHAFHSVAMSYPEIFKQMLDIAKEIPIKN